MCVSLQGKAGGRAEEVLLMGPAPLVIKSAADHGLRDTGLHGSGSEVCKWGHSLKAPLHPPVVVNAGS